MSFFKKVAYNKTVLLPKLNSLNNLLNNNNLLQVILPRCIYDDRIAIEHYNKDIYNTIRIWRTKSFLDYWYNDKTSSKGFIGALDYTVNNENIKIEYLYINDTNNNCPYYDNPLNNNESFLLTKSLINLIRKIAKEENKDKIIIDAHQNLKIYNKYYKREGFVKTERKSNDNPFWLECEILISPDENITT